MAPLPPPLALDVVVDSTTWAALAAVLTVLGVLWTLVAWRRRGPAAGLRALAWTLLPVAAWLTGTLRLAVDVADAVLRWATRLVFVPTTWAGIAVAGVAVVLWFVSGVMLGRGLGVRPRRGRGRGRASEGEPVVRESTAPPRRSLHPAPADDDMADIEAILKKHGI